MKRKGLFLNCFGVCGKGCFYVIRQHKKVIDKHHKKYIIKSQVKSASGVGTHISFLQECYDTE